MDRAYSVKKLRRKTDLALSRILKTQMSVAQDKGKGLLRHLVDNQIINKMEDSHNSSSDHDSEVLDLFKDNQIFDIQLNQLVVNKKMSNLMISEQERRELHKNLQKKRKIQHHLNRDQVFKMNTKTKKQLQQDKKYQFSDGQTQEIQFNFGLMDIQDGYITKYELQELLEDLNEEISDDAIDDLIEMAEQNPDGKINFQKFYKEIVSDKKHETSSVPKFRIQRTNSFKKKLVKIAGGFKLDNQLSQLESLERELNDQADQNEIKNMANYIKYQSKNKKQQQQQQESFNPDRFRMEFNNPPVFFKKYMQNGNCHYDNGESIASLSNNIEFSKTAIRTNPSFFTKFKKLPDELELGDHQLQTLQQKPTDSGSHLEQRSRSMKPVDLNQKILNQLQTRNSKYKNIQNQRQLQFNKSHYNQNINQKKSRNNSIKHQFNTVQNERQQDQIDYDDDDHVSVNNGNQNHTQSAESIHIINQTKDLTEKQIIQSAIKDRKFNLQKAIRPMMIDIDRNATRSVKRMQDQLKKIPKHKLKMVFSKKTTELNNMLRNNKQGTNLHKFQSSELLHLVGNNGKPLDQSDSFGEQPYKHDRVSRKIVKTNTRYINKSLIARDAVLGSKCSQNATKKFGINQSDIFMKKRESVKEQENSFDCYRTLNKSESQELIGSHHQKPPVKSIFTIIDNSPNPYADKIDPMIKLYEKKQLTLKKNQSQSQILFENRRKTIDQIYQNIDERFENDTNIGSSANKQRFISENSDEDNEQQTGIQITNQLISNLDQITDQQKTIEQNLKQDILGIQLGLNPKTAHEEMLNNKCRVWQLNHRREIDIEYQKYQLHVPKPILRTFMKDHNGQSLQYIQ